MKARLTWLAGLAVAGVWITVALFFVLSVWYAVFAPVALGCAPAVLYATARARTGNKIWRSCGLLLDSLGLLVFYGLGTLVVTGSGAQAGGSLLLITALSFVFTVHAALLGAPAVGSPVPAVVAAAAAFLLATAAPWNHFHREKLSLEHIETRVVRRPLGSLLHQIYDESKPTRFYTAYGTTGTWSLELGPNLGQYTVGYLPYENARPQFPDPHGSRTAYDLALLSYLDTHGFVRDDLQPVPDPEPRPGGRTVLRTYLGADGRHVHIDDQGSIIAAGQN